jgi:hypothetical protein
LAHLNVMFQYMLNNNNIATQKHRLFSLKIIHLRANYYYSKKVIMQEIFKVFQEYTIAMDFIFMDMQSTTVTSFQYVPLNTHSFALLTHSIQEFFMREQIMLIFL